MKKIDKLMRFKLAQEAKYARLEPAADCPSDPELNRYLSGDLPQPKKALIEEHLAECYLCLDKLVSCREGEKLLAKRKIKGPPITKKAVKKWLPKNLRKNKWLIASITAFTLSFAFPPVFLQFLLAAGILGGKWIFDSENTKTLIMIYNAWKKGGEKEASRMIETLKDRIVNKR